MFVPDYVLLPIFNSTGRYVLWSMVLLYVGRRIPSKEQHYTSPTSGVFFVRFRKTQGAKLNVEVFEKKHPHLTLQVAFSCQNSSHSKQKINRIGEKTQDAIGFYHMNPHKYRTK